MKTPTIDITINAKKIKEWEEEISSLSRKIETLALKREKLQERIKAVPLFIEDERQAALHEIGDRTPDLPIPTRPYAYNGVSVKNMPPPEAIRHTLQNAGRPLTRDEVRERLRSAKYPMEKFRHDGGYFHTIITRMEKAGKVTFDGRVITLTQK